MLTSIIELNKSALKSNIHFLKNNFPSSRISSVVKANAYGHGLKEFVSIAEDSGIDHFSVFSSNEAKIVKNELKGNSNIMIMGWVDDNDIDWILKNEIEVFAFDFERLHKFFEKSKKLNKKVQLHIDLETGMNRTGFPNNDIERLIKLLLENKDYFYLKGICTHFAGAESIANYKRIQDQINSFNDICSQFLKNGFKPEYRHTACSAAALSYPQTQFEMVRIGILQYGFWPSKETLIQFMSNQKEKSDPLKQILTWKSNVMAIKKVKTGEFISYGTSYLAQKDMQIAIIPVGYSHGYARNLSNQGRVLINGQRVGVIGMVNMNMLIVDISTIDSVQLGDEVVLIGEQNGLRISVSSFSEFSDQLNYEMLTRLPGEIERCIVE